MRRLFPALLVLASTTPAWADYHGTLNQAELSPRDSLSWQAPTMDSCLEAGRRLATPMGRSRLVCIGRDGDVRSLACHDRTGAQAGYVCHETADVPVMAPTAEDERVAARPYASTPAAPLSAHSSLDPYWTETAFRVAGWVLPYVLPVSLDALRLW